MKTFPKTITFYKYKNNIHYNQRQRIIEWVNSHFLFNGKNKLDLHIYKDSIGFYFMKIIDNGKSRKQDSQSIFHKQNLDLSIINIKQEIINMILDISQNDDILNKIDDPLFVNSIKNFHFNHVILNTKLE